jgi:hypothetical protein
LRADNGHMTFNMLLFSPAGLPSLLFSYPRADNPAGD